MRKILLVLLLSVAAGAVLSADNLKVSGTHAIGNGKVCAYAKDADLTGIFGPTYSSPTLLTVSLETPATVQAAPVDLTGVWEVSLDGGAARMRDFADAGKCVFVRKIDKVSSALSFRVELLPETRAYREEHLTVEASSKRGASSAWRIKVSEGVPFYSAYASPSEYHAEVFTTGGVRLESTGDPFVLNLVAEGKGALYVVMADSSESLDKELRRVRPRFTGCALRRSLRFWKRTQRNLPEVGTEVLFPAGAAELDSTLRLVSNYVIAQQDAGGGILAGKNYHMAYVRDQYGNSRGLLAMGHLERARELLDFYYRIWCKHGLIHNAQPMGNDGPFHCHEDDNTEITGYLVVQAMDYLRRSGDSAFIERIMPMLRWASIVQQEDLIDGMLPFNGDETYIAGGILPRSVMYHGSAEATLLFIEGSRHLLSYLEEHPSSVWSADEIEALRRDSDASAASYRDNFFYEGKLYINNPAREDKVVYPPTRPGVCLYPGVPLGHFPVTYHFKGNLYFCEDCMKKDTTGIEPAAPRRYSIPSAFLFPIYIDAQLFSREEKEALLDEVVDYYSRTGRIDERNIVLGYDYGLFLYALAEYANPLADEVYRKMMDLRDSSLSWVEYYVDGVPFNTPCRPWESSINIAAALKYAKAK